MAPQISELHPFSLIRQSHIFDANQCYDSVCNNWCIQSKILSRRPACMRSKQVDSQARWKSKCKRREFNSQKSCTRLKHLNFHIEKKLRRNKNSRSEISSFQNPTFTVFICFNTKNKTSFSAFIIQNTSLDMLDSRYPKRFIRQTHINQIILVQLFVQPSVTQPTPGMTDVPME